MTEKRKLKVFCAGESFEVFRGTDIKFSIDPGSDRLKIRVEESAEHVAMFNDWRYVRFIEDDYTDALHEIRNLVQCGNPMGEKLHFIGVELCKIGLLSEQNIPPKEG